MPNCGSLSGYTKGCANYQGGVEKAYIIETSNISSVVSASGVVTTLTLAGGKSLYTYDQEINTAFGNDNPVPNRTNGTFYADQTVTLTLLKRQAATSYDIKTLAQQNVSIILKERTGKYMLYGAVNGLRLDPASTSGTGTNMGDSSNYVLAFKGMEPELALEVPSNIFAGLSVV